MHNLGLNSFFNVVQYSKLHRIGWKCWNDVKMMTLLSQNDAILQKTFLSDFKNQFNNSSNEYGGGFYS